jgi:hypothetical protein
MSMRFLKHLVAALAVSLLAAACDSRATDCCALVQPSLRVVNGFTTAVDVLIDGNVAISSLAAGEIGTTAPTSGSHSLSLRPVGGGVSPTQSITTTSGGTTTVAAVRSISGSISATVLDDTNSVVPTGATKVRVLHLAPTAGTLQVYRTQPDFATPVSWQFPFNYQPDPTPLSAPFFQSTVGTWEVRVWQTPADASGWTNAPVRISIPLESGQKATVVILDRPGGGLRIERL